MYYDFFDSVKTSNNYTLEEINTNICIGTTALFYETLSGEVPVLSIPQLTDSLIIKNIISSADREHFLDILKAGHIKIAIQKEFMTLQHYFIEKLKQGLDGGNPFFEFSSMSFLSDKMLYPAIVRVQIQSKMIDAIIYGNLEIEIPEVEDKTHLKTIRELVADIVELNLATAAHRIQTTEPNISLKSTLDKLIRTFFEIQKDNEFEKLYEEIKLQQEKTPNFSNSRSAYYNFLKDKRKEKIYTEKTISNTRSIVDVAYNMVVGMSIDGSNGISFSTKEFERKVGEAIGEVAKPEETTENRISKVNKSEYLTWETLKKTLNELTNIEKSLLNHIKNKREEALKIYKSRNRLAPFVITGKYLALSSLTCLIGDMGIVEMVSKVSTDILPGIATDALTEKLKKPSICEVFSSLFKWKRNNKVMHDVIVYTKQKALQN